jgi:hypothetical protein
MVRFFDPIQLVWMVKEIVLLPRSRPNLIHHPDELDGVLACISAGFF